ncbi:FAD/NAD(P)-binding domain-containing protein [Sarocladium strictum]
MPDTNTALDVIVVGGGVCGMSCAIGLRRAGHNVTVYEKYTADDAVGAGIVLPPNSSRILRQWGIDLASVGATRYRKGLIIDGKSLQVEFKAHDETIGERELPVDAQINTTRPDLGKALRTEALRSTSEDEGAGSIQIEYSHEVVDYDAEGPAVVFADGSRRSADLVVACDGIKSKALSTVTASEIPAIPTGFSAFRLLLPVTKSLDVLDKYRDDAFIWEKLEGADSTNGTVWFAIEHPGRIFVWWTCREGEEKVHACDIVIPDNEGYTSLEDWRARSNKDALVREFSHWHPIFTDLVAAADDELYLWKICAREPVDVVHRGGLCVLGDALHPMGPYRGQGGSQSIEDAAVLEVCLTGIQDKGELLRRLEMLRELRVPRYAASQLASTVRQDEQDYRQRILDVLARHEKWFANQPPTICKFSKIFVSPCGY